MTSCSNIALLPGDGVSAADEQRCICIIQDNTSESRKRHTHTLPISTTTSRLFKVVANELKYELQTFTMTFSRSPFSVANDGLNFSNRLEPSQVQTLDDVGFFPGEKTYIKVGPMNGMKPIPSTCAPISEKHDSREGGILLSQWNRKSSDSDMKDVYKNIENTDVPAPPPVPPKITQNTQRRNAVSADDCSAPFSELIPKQASKIKGVDFKGVEPRLIGLVNQAMTCYLNSLIQTLYMTPEFRNALYEWEYKGDDVEASTTIPFQLQRLFLALQTSDKQAVETTDLTKSFGWDSSEAWQQHDIQELCRVMFDALEQKFKESAGESEKSGDSKDLGGLAENKTETKGSGVKTEEKRNEPEIIKLYEGTMNDYVQCAECKNETSRNDSYLDIPITIRPFGSSVTYGSVTKGLEAFVEPETLDGANQYFCEKCNKKCDAKKGLKFTSFPYLLTLQLKRFDFDYLTMHRVKLNDRMYFPMRLDLNSFIEVEEEKHPPKDQNSDKESECSAELDANDAEAEEEGDSSSRDSGNDDDRPSRSSSHRVPRVPDSEEGSSVDEGIDIESQSGQTGPTGASVLDDGIESGNSTPGAVGGAVKPEIWEGHPGKVKQGKYVYELFSIMIHSGSAVGGHYYAYIKSFDDNQWYCFNDQIVSPISEEDIEKSYGGSNGRSSYSSSSSFSSSTNAYMLMYRQIHPERNKGFIKTEDLPDHIKRLREEEEGREIKMREQKEKEKNMCNIKVYCRHPVLTKKQNVAIVEELFEFHNTITLRDATLEAYKLLKLKESEVSLENCRLVKYDHYHESLDQSLDDEEENQDLHLATLLGGSRMSYLFDLLMETKEDHERFDTYKPNGVTIKVFAADYRKGCFQDMVVVRLMPDDNVYHLKQVLAKKLHYPLRRIRLAYEKYVSDIHLLTSSTQTLRDIGVYRSLKVYVDLMDEEECKEMDKIVDDPNRKYANKSSLSIKETRLWSLIDRAANLINVEVQLPEDSPNYEPPSSRLSSPFSTDTPPPSPTDSIPPLIDQSPPCEVESCPEAPPGSVRSTPSSDEGVGSYDGSSGSSSVPKTAKGSTVASPKDRTQPVECPAAAASSSSQSDSDETTLFWRTSDATYFSEDNMFPDMHDSLRPRTSQPDDEFQSSQHLRRNSEEDEGCSPGPPNTFTFSADFKQELDRKLHEAGFGLSQSPTSSTKCEDGSSSEVSSQASRGSSPDTSSQTSGEFEIQDGARQQGDGTLGAADSAGSCSTIDSTGTLCNTTDEAIEPEDNATIYPPYSHHTKDLDDCTCPNLTVPQATKMSALPGMARPVTNVTFSTASDYMDMDERVDKGQSTSNVTTPGGFCDCPKILSVGETTDGDNPTKNQHWDSGPSYLCGTCGRFKAGCMAGSITSTGSQEQPGQDPESGEGMDHISPLFADLEKTECGAGDSGSEAKPKYLEMTCMNNAYSEEGTSRQRTESSSSVLSDLGYGDQNHKEHCYFHVRSVQTNDDLHCQVLKAHLDKRTTVGALKRKLQPIVQVPTRNFSIYRVYQSGQETELNSLNENFLLVPDDTRLRVKQQKALRKDEHRCKVYHLNIADDDHVKHFFDFVVKKGLTIKEARQGLAEDLLQQQNIKVDPERIRLRKKTMKTPGRIYLDHEEFGKDIYVAYNQDIFLEILENPEMKICLRQLSVYCRRWRPSTLTLERPEEVIIEPDGCSKHTVDNLKECLSELSGLDVKDIEWAKPKGNFPFLMSVLDINGDLDWDPAFVTHLNAPLVSISDDGSIIFYRDKRETLKELNDKERSELQQKESTRLAKARSSSTSNTRGSSNRPYFRKEKALKIYTVGNSSKKKEKTAPL